MKTKLILTIAIVLLAVAGLRWAIDGLSEPSKAVEEAVAEPVANSPLPNGAWSSASATDNNAAPQSGGALMPEPPVEEEVVEEPPLTAEQLLPETAELLIAVKSGDDADSKQALARFVQEADFSIAQIESTLQDLNTQDYEAERKQAYIDLGQQKIAAIRALKQKALDIDSELLYLPLKAQEY